MNFQTNFSRRQFFSTATTTAVGIALNLRAGAADIPDSRVAEIVRKTIGIDTHNHIDVPLTAGDMPGPISISVRK